MYKLVTIYRKVDDEALLEDFFATTHLPLAEQLTGLKRVEVSRVIRRPGGESRFHLMCEIYFEDEAAYEEAMLSETGMKLLEELKPWFEGKLLTWFEAESFSEDH